MAIAAGLDSRLSAFGLYVLVLALTAPVFAAHSGGLARVLPRRIFRNAENPAEPAARTDDDTDQLAAKG